MSVNFKVVAANTAPSYQITCTRDGVAMDLSSASSVTLKIKRSSDGVITQVGKQATITTPTSGVISYTASATDFPSAGKYVADIKVDYGGGSLEILYNQASWKVRAPIT